MTTFNDTFKTAFTEKQVKTIKAFFAANPNKPSKAPKIVQRFILEVEGETDLLFVSDSFWKWVYSEVLRS